MTVAPTTDTPLAPVALTDALASSAAPYSQEPDPSPDQGDAMPELQQVKPVDISADVPQIGAGFVGNELASPEAGGAAPAVTVPNEAAPMAAANPYSAELQTLVNDTLTRHAQCLKDIANAYAALSAAIHAPQHPEPATHIEEALKRLPRYGQVANPQAIFNKNAKRFMVMVEALEAIQAGQPLARHQAAVLGFVAGDLDKLLTFAKDLNAIASNHAEKPEISIPPAVAAIDDAFIFNLTHAIGEITNVAEKKLPAFREEINQHLKPVDPQIQAMVEYDEKAHAKPDQPPHLAADPKITGSAAMPVMQPQGHHTKQVLAKQAVPAPGAALVR